MDKAKQAIHDIQAKAGHHDTTVHEHVGPAVTEETVKPTRHEEVQTAVDKEVHQDHYHRTVQPVFDKEVLPEQHQHRVAGVETREFDHRKNDRTKEQFEAERGQLHNERHVGETQTTQSRAAAVQGEHVHHHVHEEIQPVLHKEVIQPEVVHTTVPVHEVHHEAAKHHGTTTLPAVNMSEFKQQGGVLEGGRERRDHFEGCAKGLHSEGCGHDQEGRDIGLGSRQTHSSSTTSGTTGHHHGEHHSHTGTGVGSTGTSDVRSTGTSGVGSTGTSGVGHSSTTGTSGVGHDSRLPGAGHSNIGSSTTGTHGTTGTTGHSTTTGTHGTTGTHNTTTGNNSGLHQTESHKASLLDKLNPMKDADGDGKKGFMS